MRDAPRRPAPAGLAGEVRLIAGRWRRSRLPVADRPGLRPTPDRVRETLFNWLGQDLTGWHVLDAFAGSGALGFEAASRGAAGVVLLESDPALCRSLEASRLRLDADAIAVVRADALAWMARAASQADGAAPARFDLVLLDPPFGTGLAGPAVAAAAPLVVPGGWLYLEAAERWPEPPAGFSVHRALRAGAVHAHLWRRGP
jgi:16S rRNA (guanine(966)-N(2))-methyltransferase RsmD